MNYIDATLTAAQTLIVNTNVNDDVVATTDITWTLTKEGNDDSSFTFSTPSANASMSASGYFQALTIDLDDEGIDLDDEHSYLLQGVANSKVIYLGKVFVTSTDLDAYSVNDNHYVEKTSSNNYIILE